MVILLLLRDLFSFYKRIYHTFLDTLFVLIEKKFCLYVSDPDRIMTHFDP